MCTFTEVHLPCDQICTSHCAKVDTHTSQWTRVAELRRASCAIVVTHIVT